MMMRDEEASSSSTSMFSRLNIAQEIERWQFYPMEKMHT
jgi:hypothetical protein